MSTQATENKEELERLFLVYVNADSAEDDCVEAELEGLVEAANGEVVGSARQRVEKKWKATYVGKGKVQEIKEAAAETGAEGVVFDCELSGLQIKTLEERIEMRVIDRTTLILDIFARRARTREGQLQVELAQYSYRLPRLMSVYTKFERQRGGIGMRGPGETKLESDRRMVRDRIDKLQADIDNVKKHRLQQRASRMLLPYPSVAIIGYTSAGKSTLMNALCGTDLLADAMPFATLDPTTRKLDLPDGFSFFISDTVGFIRQLPTLLVAAFRATLEETIQSDLLLHIIDVSSPDWETQRDAVNETIGILGASDVQVLTVFNKIDALEDKTQARRLVAEFPNSVAISAKNGTGLENMLEQMQLLLKGRYRRLKALVPYDKANLVESSYSFGRVLIKDYREEGIYLEADLSPEMFGKLEKYACDD